MEIPKQGKRARFASLRAGTEHPHNDLEVIQAFGGHAELSRKIGLEIGMEYAPTRRAIHQWSYKGIAPDWRPTIARMAAKYGIRLYDDFLEPKAVRQANREAAPAA